MCQWFLGAVVKPCNWGLTFHSLTVLFIMNHNKKKKQMYRTSIHLYWISFWGLQGQLESIQAYIEFLLRK